ncbi:MAG: ELM1/GtrOC1 family putative glycosyltransferase [Gammaproteobacteria bacterium]|nr:ELM1/GtrOC1 family putative glycosyltransferase [Gammaproteobacteria bacterium]
MTSKVEPPAAPGHPPCVVMPASGEARGGAEPVRIFLGTEDNQSRAFRVFMYSVARHRDPGREYRVYLMKNLPGFRRRGWRTGFTQYRFAIPEFGGCSGRAIYNDVDQIYTVDPGQLFDLPLGEAGYLAVSAEDTSVMVMDCERMAPWWNLEQARHGRKRELTRAPAQAGLWGPLDGRWNARDLEYVTARSGVLHYTALHLQPWQPAPTAYSYHSNPLAEVWEELQRAADDDDYEVFSEDVPSPWFAAARQALGQASGETPGEAPGEKKRAAAGRPAGDGVVALARERGVRELLWCGPRGMAEVPPPLPVTVVWPWDFGHGEWPAAPADMVAVAGVLEHLPAEDVPWVLDALARRARRVLYVTVAEQPVVADGALGHRREYWWRRELRRVAARHPHLAWHLDYHPLGARTRLCAQAPAREGVLNPARPPRVWVLTGHRHGDAEQLRTLARALGWPWEEKRLAYNAFHHLPNGLAGPSRWSVDGAASDPLEAPWPDVVLACGKRSVPVARWIKAQSGGHTQLVHLGRPWAPLHHFDLVVTTPQYGLPLRDNVRCNVLPLNRPPAQDDPTETAHWQEAFAGLPRPWIGVLVGGGSLSYRFDATEGRRLGGLLNDLARRHGGSLLLTTSPRTPAAAVTALFDAIDVPAHRHRWGAGAETNPLGVYLASCDRFVVTGDSASMLAETVATGRPVELFPLAEAAPGLGCWVRGVGQFLTGSNPMASHRGTPRQQDWRGRWRDRLVAAGVLQTARDMGRLHQELLARGLVRPLGAESEGPAPIPPPDELALTVAWIREGLGERHWREVPGGGVSGDGRLATGQAVDA